MNEELEEIARKLRLTQQEFKDFNLLSARLIGSSTLIKNFGSISGLTAVYCPTITNVTLGNVDWKIARYFEDA